MPSILKSSHSLESMSDRERYRRYPNRFTTVRDRYKPPARGHEVRYRYHRRRRLMIHFILLAYCHESSVTRLILIPRSRSRVLIDHHLKFLFHSIRIMIHMNFNLLSLSNSKDQGGYHQILKWGAMII